MGISVFEILIFVGLVSGVLWFVLGSRKKAQTEREMEAAARAAERWRKESAEAAALARSLMKSPSEIASDARAAIDAEERQRREARDRYNDSLRNR